MRDVAHNMRMLTYAEYAYDITSVELISHSEEEKRVVHGWTGPPDCAVLVNVQ